MIGNLSYATLGLLTISALLTPSIARGSGESINVNVGTLPSGKSTTITFAATVDDPLVPATTSSVSNQATISGTNFANVLSDDPAVGGASDPTVTALLTDTNTAITSSDVDNTTVFGEQVTFTATVEAVPNTLAIPTGDVEFLDGATSLGTDTLDGAGQATIDVFNLSVGAHTIHANYLGEGDNKTSTDNRGHTVDQADVTVTITADTPDPSVRGQAVTFTYTVTPTAPGAGTPTGNVTVSDGTNMNTDTVAAGTTNITINDLGTTNFTADYAGDTNFNSGSSTPEAHEVVNQAPVFTSTPVTLLTEGDAYNYAITVTDADADGITISAPTLPAWMNFVDNTDGTATLTGDSTGQAGVHNVTLMADDGNDSVQQIFEVTVLAPAAVVLYGLEGTAPFTVTIIDPATGAVTSTLGNLQLPGETLNGVFAMAMDPLSGIMYAIVRDLNGFVRLCTIDLPTATATSVAILGDGVTGLTFETSGQLWGVTDNSGGNPNSLVKIDKANGNITVQAALSGDHGHNIAYNTDNDRLYYLAEDATNQPVFESIDPTTIVSTPIAISGDAFAGLSGLVWDKLAAIFRFDDTNGDYFTLSETGVATDTTNDVPVPHAGLAFDQQTTVPVEISDFAIE